MVEPLLVCTSCCRAQKHQHSGRVAISVRDHSNQDSIGMAEFYRCEHCGTTRQWGLLENEEANGQLSNM